MIGPDETSNSQDLSELPTGWRWVRIGDVCEVNPRRPALVRADSDLTSFIPMAAVSDEGKGWIQVEARAYSEVRQGYTYFAEGDVLFAKITPCMQNGKIAVAANLIDRIGFGSTEFHVLRASQILEPLWLQLFLRQTTVLETAVKHMTGSVGQQRLPATYLQDLEIPLPPLHEQRRIAAILSGRLAAVEGVRAAAEAQLAAAKALPAAYLRAVFESEEAQEWPRVKLDELVNRLSKGESPEWQGFQYVSDGPLFIRSENVRWGTFSHAPVTHIPSEFHHKLARSQVKRGDVLVNLVGASIGRACVAPDILGDANVNQAVAVITPGSRLHAAFLCYFLVSPSTQLHFKEVQVEAARPNISLQNLRELLIPVPSLANQSALTSRLTSMFDSTRDLTDSVHTQLDAINALPQALLRRAFSGAF